MKLLHWLKTIQAKVRAIRTPSRRPTNLRRTARHVSMELLETRCLLAGVWDGGGATDDWNEPLNWDDDQLPNAADDVVIGAGFSGITVTSTNDVTINSLTTEAALAISGGTFTILANSTINNAVSVSATGTLTLDTLTLGGSGTLTNSATVNLLGSTITTALSNQGLLLVKAEGGESTINGALTTNGSSTIRVRADGSVGAATLTVANSFTNNGAVELTAINGSGNTATLNVASGTLTSAATGTIQSLAGTGGARNLNAQLDNQGVITVAQGLTINQASADHTNSGTINVSGGDLLVTQSGTTPTFTNSSTGTFTIASGRTLNLSGGSFTNFSAGTLTNGVYNVTGTLKFDGAAITTNAATIVLDGVSSQIVNESNANALSGFNNNAVGGNFTIKNGRDFSSPSTFTNAGNLTVEAPSVFSMLSGTFNFNGGTVTATTGTVQLSSSTLHIAPAAGAGTFSMRGSSTLGSTSNVLTGQVILVQGDNSNGSATLTEADGFSNAGTITLETVAGSTSTSNLSVNIGELTNAAGGVIDVNTGGGGSRTIAANLTNNGTVTLDESATFSKSSGNYTNNSAFNIATGKTLTINGSSQVFTQAGGTLAVDGAFNLTSATFNFDDPELVAGPSVITGVPVLTAANLNIGTGSTGAATFSIRSSSNFSGNIAPGQEIRIQGDASNGSATLTAANGFNNAGTITLQTIESTSNSNLTVSHATEALTNTATGVINVNTGTGGSRTIAANLINNGTVNLNESTTFSKSSGSYTNNGDFNLADGETLTINGSSQTFHQNGGTLDLLGTSALFDLSNSATFNFNGGSITGTPRLTSTTLNIGNDSNGAAEFSIRGSANFSGNVAPGQIIRVQGDATNGSATLTAAGNFSNSGNITLETVSGSTSTSNLTVTSGTLTNATGGVIDVNAGGGGSRTISANLTNDGTVNLNTSTTFSKSSGSYINNNAFNIAAGQTLTINGSSQAFTQAGGTLAATGLFDLSSAAFNFNGGIVTGTPRLTAATLNIGNGSNGAAEFSTRSSSVLTGDVAAAQTILIQGDNTNGSATLTAANSFNNAGIITLESVAGSTSSSNLTVSTGTLNNSGTINFTAGGGGGRTLTTELANSGFVNVSTTATLGRTSADHTNSGTINVTGGDLTVSQSGTTPTFGNSGIINIADTRTLNITGGELANFSGGTLTGGTFNITGKLQFPGAAITTNAATIVLNGANSQIVNESDTNGLTNFATNAAAGSFTIQNGRNFTTATGITEFANAGSMNITAGTTFTVSNDKKYSQTAGTTTLNGTLVTSNSVEVDIQGGTLQGSGDITGNLRNASQVNPGTSPGSLDVSGDYSQTADGILNIEIGGTTPITQFDQINIVGSASLNGTLNVSRINSFVPNVADAFQIMTFGSHTGDFATKNGLTITSTLNFDPQFNVPGLLLDVNGSPVFTSNAAQSTAENTTAVTTVTTTDPDVPPQTVTYSIVGGADSAKLQIVEATGVLSFVAAPDFEIPTDAGTNNVYNVTVQANDGHGGLTTQEIAVTVTPVNDNSPVFTSSATANVAENTTAVLTVIATDADLPGQSVSYSLTGGADQAKFSITSGGVLTFQAPPDFESPTDDGTNNVYNVQVTANDNNGLTTVQNIAVTVTAINDNSPIFTSVATADVAENTTAVLTVTATDADQPAQSVTFSLVGGADELKFSITSGGVLTFQAAPDFENPTDVGEDNIYNVTVQASDGNGGTTMQNIVVTVTPVSENVPVFTSAATANVAENTTAVLTVTATDADLPAQTVTFTIFGGADAGKFSITSEGVLTFQNAPDFETPTDVGTDNVYNVTIRANDGDLGVTNQSIAVTVTPVNDNSPVFTSTTTANVATNTTAVRTVTATDADQPLQNITFSITGGADQNKFSITSGGVLTFQTAPDFAIPTDVGTDNVYDVQVTANDNNGRTTAQDIAVTVTDIPINPPVFTSSETANVAENTTAVLTVTATDIDVGQTATFSIIGGADQLKFSITSEGVLTFQTAPDFETPTDSGTDNIYNVRVQADDGNGGLATQDIAVTVTAVNDNSPIFTSSATANVAENTTAVLTVIATDADMPVQGVTYSLSGGTDQTKFSITSGGVLTFQAAPDFELPTDDGTDNVYNVQVTANDNNGRTTVQNIAVTVTPVNDNSPIFTSSATVNVAENVSAVVTVVATDADSPSQTVTYSLTGGTDQAKFSITSGGVLTFQAAPDFELPTDDGTNNVYNVQVTANDNNGLTTVQDIAVTVTAVNDNSPVFTSAATANVAENTTAVLTVIATDADMPVQGVTYSLSGGTDQAKFSITSGGVLTFQAAPDFETPTDNGTDNVYNVQVTANDNNGLTTVQDIAVSVTPVNDNSPVFTSSATANVAENTTAVLTVIATDADMPVQGVTYSLSGGTDQAKFSITSGGVLTFQAAPDFELPTDDGTDNVYNVQVTANDNNGLTTVQNITVTVTAVNDNSPIFTSAATANVAENTTAVLTVIATDADMPVQGVTYSLSGGTDQAKFSITSGGVLTFQAAPDFETATDDGTDNVYNVQVTANDNNGRTTVQDIAVTVTPVNDNSPIFTSSATANVAENTTAVLTVIATDADMPVQGVTYSLSGGTDQAKFSITSGGVLTFQAAPDFELPTDDGTDNVYNVQVTANDNNGLTTVQNIAVSVTAVNDNNPLFTSSATFNVAENTTAIATVVATDADVPSQNVTFSLTGGADQAKFSMTSGGVLTFTAGHDFEIPNDVGTNNVYNVQVTANDGNGRTTTQDIAVTVTPVNDNSPIFTSVATVNVAENVSAVVTVVATDADSPSQTVSFSLTGGTDQAKFSITSGGVLTFQAAPDFETPTDNGTNNVYNVQVTANDNNGLTTVQNIAVTVTAVNDNNPSFTSSATFNVAENSTAVGTAIATDADSPAQSVTFSLTGGADQSKFSITSGGVLTFNAVHDFENPNDAGTNNVYNVQVTANDGNGGTTTQDIAVTVTNLAPSTPTDGDPAGSTIIVNSANGTTVGITAVATDPAGGTVTFTLTNNAGGRFTINNSSGVVTVANGTLIGSAGTHTITVQASDAILTASADFEITITNISADFGDAPTAAQSGFASSYPTTFANNGAFHLPTGPTLGATRDVEFDGQPNLAASGDDTTGGTDDEEGISFLSSFETGRATAIRVNVQNAAVTGNFLDAWIDWNRDGDWNDAGEQVSAGQAMISGDNVVTITVPTNASIGDTYARFRLSTTGGLAPTGEATDGEVEDYRVSVAAGSAIQLATRAAQPTSSQTVGGSIDVISSAGTANRSVSDDGRYVVFISNSNNLVPDDTNNTDDVFRFDRVTGEIRLVSVNRTGTASTTGGGSGFGRNTNPVISADGQIVAFTSQATDLVTNDTNGRTDVFVRNFNTNTTTLVSVNSANTASGNGDSAAPMLSTDGTVVGFLSTSSNLAAGDTNGVQDVFVRNLTTNTTSIVSLNRAGNASGNGLSDRFTLSADGRSVAFHSFATNLTAITDTNGFSDVFVRNLATNTTTMVSVNSAGNNGGNNTSFSPSISADGRVVSFLSLASNLVTNDTNGAITDVFVRNLTTNVTRLVSINSTANGSGDNHSGGNVTSADGSTVAFQSTASNLVTGDANGVLDVFVRNLAANATTLVSVSSASAASGNGQSFGPALSANGQTVAFISLASNLTANDSNGVVRDVFVRDLGANTTTLASTTASGSGSGASGLNAITISANGRTVAFESDATNLVAGDNNSAKDVFTFAIPGGNAAPSAPLDVNVAANTVIENAAAGTIVGVTAFSTDPEATTVSYSLTNNAGGRFAINSSTGVVTVANGGLIDFETATIHTITVQASDGANVSSAQFTINVQNDPSVPAELVVNLTNTANTITVSRIVGNLLAVRSGATDLIAPTQFNDFTALRIVGGTASDSVTLDASLVGFLGAFAMDGNAGNDTLIATAITGVGFFNTQFFGGDGADLARGGAGVDFFDGGAGNDSLFGNAGNDFLSGGADNDSLDGGDGDDLVSGGQGNDALLGGGTTALPGNDSLAEVVDGTLTLTATGMTGLGTDTVSGFERATLTGGNGNDTINASTFAGIVILSGGGGNDMLFGGLGADTIHGGEGNDTLVGNAGNDSLEGQAGNDSLTGSAGSDALLGGADDDVYSFAVAATPAEVDTVIELANEGRDLLDFSGVTVAVTVNLTSDGTTAPNSLASHANRTVRTGAVGQAANFEGARGGSGADAITGNAADNFLDGGVGNDTLTGNAGNDTLSGGAGLDSLVGGVGNDMLNGGDGNDALLGGADNDLYFFQAATAAEIDTLTEIAGPAEGIDRLDFSSLSIAVSVSLGSDAALASHANRTVKTAAAGQAANFEEALGGAGNDILSGNSATNRLEGGGGNDLLNGLAGNDSLIGGLGDDVYFFQAAIANETDTLTELINEGLDRLDFGALLATNAVTVNLSSDTALATHTNRTLQTSAVGQAENFENANGGAANDSLTGNAANNSLTGGTGNDTLAGADGNDTLNGGGGNDSLVGQLGDDTYFFVATGFTETDTLSEVADAGSDSLDFSSLAATVPVTVNLNSDAALATYAGRTIRTASAGQAENFENVNGGFGNDLITGNVAANLLRGGFGNDTLEGGAGNDTLEGAPGVDELRHTFDGDQVLTNSTLTGQGVDTFSGFARVFLTGGNGNNLIDASAFTTGNVTLSGLGGNDTLLGSSLNDSILGGEGTDSLNGGAGNDTVDGGAGDGDSVTGGLGDDVLIGGAGTGDVLVKSVNGTATLTNTSVTNPGLTGSGTDSYSGVELVSITGGTGNDVITATAYTGALVINGGDGADQLQAGTGSNTLNGGAGADLLTGNNGNDSLVGGADNDTLVGNAGNDTLAGGLGDDLYRFLAATAAEADVVSESANEGADRLDFSGLAATVAVSANLSSDSSLASHANRTITATSGQAENIEQVLGGAGNDSLIGNGANNRLEGGVGNDTLNGGAGNDALFGGAGNDTYRFLDSASAETDTLTELAPDGNDSLDFSGLTVAVAVNLASDASLAVHANRTVVATAGQAANFENAIGGAGNDTLTGNALINSLNGGAGNDTLEGGAGNDVLTGGLDQDEVRQTVDANQILTDTSLTGLGTDLLNSIERAVLNGGATANLLNASAFTKVAVLNGLGGNDTLTGGGRQRLDQRRRRQRFAARQQRQRHAQRRSQRRHPRWRCRR